MRHLYTISISWQKKTYVKNILEKNIRKQTLGTHKISEKKIRKERNLNISITAIRIFIISINRMFLTIFERAVDLQTRSSDRCLGFLSRNTFPTP